MSVCLIHAFVSLKCNCNPLLPSKNMLHAALSDFIMLLARRYHSSCTHTHTYVYERLYLYQLATETELQMCQWSPVDRSTCYSVVFAYIRTGHTQNSMNHRHINTKSLLFYSFLIICPSVHEIPAALWYAVAVLGNRQQVANQPFKH